MCLGEVGDPKSIVVNNLSACVILFSSTETLKCRHTKEKWLLCSSKIGDLPVNCDRGKEGMGNNYMMDHDSESTWRVDKRDIKTS